MHKLLQRQVKKHLESLELLPPEVRALLEAVDEAYVQADHDRALLERSLDITAQELMEANQGLTGEREELEQRVRERTAELTELNASLEREVRDRRAAEAGVSRSEEKYRALFEESQDAIYISTHDGQLIDINRAGLELFGYASKQEMLALDLAESCYQRPEDRRRMREELEAEGLVRDLELHLKHRDGTPFTVLATSSTIFDEAGRPLGYRGILRDVTQERELQRTLRQVQKMEAVGQLAGGVAHDFNNLLAVIMGYSDLIARKLEEGDPKARQVKEIRRAAERGSELTRQLLALSKCQVLSPKRLDLNAVVSDMDQLLRRLISADIELATELVVGAGTVEADPSQLEQVILNLVVNARDAMPEGGTLTVRTYDIECCDQARHRDLGMKPGPYVVLEVADTGTGIDPGSLERIFEPFFTTKENGKGTGLGLATVYGIVRQSGGDVHVESEPGGGSTFQVFLPRCEGRAERAAAAGADPTSPGGDETILLVEDEAPVREMLGHFLRQGGYRVHEAAHGAAALEVAGRLERFDLLLTDMVMPHMNGVELAEKLKGEYPDLQVLLVSGYTDTPESIHENPVLKGSIRFLQKPFANDLLARTLRDILDRRAADRAA